MKPKEITPMIPSRTSRETALPPAERQDLQTRANEPASPEGESAIREKALEILRREYPGPAAAVPATPTGPAHSRSSSLHDEGLPASDDQSPSPASAFRVPPSDFTDPIPARMLNEFVYCPRLFYYEFVEGVFVESADTLRGGAIHQRVDSGNGALPAAAKKRKSEEKMSSAKPGNVEGTSPLPSPQGGEGDGEPEVIHSRSVQMGSERLGIVAKMDLVESKSEKGDLLSALEVCPVDYKAGAPKEGQEENELWDTDKMQLGLQALILRDNGYTCNEGVIYYRATKQRVRLAINAELENWILQQIADAKRLIAGPIPPPLVHSPKCVRCSLAPVCLPDETRLLEQPTEPTTPKSEIRNQTSEIPIRRLIAARDDTRPLYLNTPGYRVGCRDEVLTIKDKDKLVDEVRMRDVSHVALFGNIQISTQAIQALCEQEVPVTYFSMGGWFYGITRGHALKNVFLRMEQFRLARD